VRGLSGLRLHGVVLLLLLLVILVAVVVIGSLRHGLGGARGSLSDTFVKGTTGSLSLTLARAAGALVRGRDRGTLGLGIFVLEVLISLTHILKKFYFISG
jgi:hypothetical protein